MAAYPRTQSEISALTELMIAGYSEHAGDFPSADVAALTTARDQYQAASEALTDAQSAAKLAAVAKAEKLEQLQAVTRRELKKSEVDTIEQPEKLGFIGWGTKSEPKSMQAPSTPTNLIITAQGIGGTEENRKGILSLKWSKSSYLKTRFVRFYSVERRQLPLNGNGQWQHIASAINNEIILKEEPTGVRLEYRVKAVNKGGESPASNTIAVVL